MATLMDEFMSTKDAYDTYSALLVEVEGDLGNVSGGKAEDNPADAPHGGRIGTLGTVPMAVPYARCRHLSAVNNLLEVSLEFPPLPAHLQHALALCVEDWQTGEHH